MAGLIGPSFGGVPLAWTPVISSTAGSITAYTVNSSSMYRWSRWVYLQIDVTISNNGTGAGAVLISTPISVSRAPTLTGKEIAQNGKMLLGYWNGTQVVVYQSDASAYPGTSGMRLIISGFAEV